MMHGCDFLPASFNKPIAMTWRLLFVFSLSLSAAHTLQPSCSNAKTKISRRPFLFSFLTASIPAVAPGVANAAYGQSASIEVPSYIDFLIEKSKTVDPDSFLYKGADAERQLQKIASAAKRLTEIPGLAEEKKWSQISGILTGPLGELVQTMTLVSGSSNDSKEAVKKVKADLYAIGNGAAKKSESACKEATAAALKDLETFVKIAF